MNQLRIILAAMTLAVLLYTWSVVSFHGWGFVPAFVFNLLGFAWSGQFALDFACYLALSALWVAWRHQFSIIGWICAAFSAILGILFFGPYVIIASFQSQGDLRHLLLGRNSN